MLNVSKVIIGSGCGDTEGTENIHETLEVSEMVVGAVVGFCHFFLQVCIPVLM